MKLAVADVETDMIRVGSIPKTKFWGLAVKDEGYRRFSTTAEICAYLLSREDPLMIYNHHDFDVLILLMEGAPIKIQHVRGGKVLSARLGVHEWRNSFAIFESKLEKILASCGFQKRSLDQLDERNIDDTVSALASFEILNERFANLFGIAPLGGKYLTAASVAFAAAERISGPLPVDLRRRDLYRGGRTEAFRLGNCGIAKCYDIRSSYPSCFLNVPNSDTCYVVDIEVDRKAFIPPVYQWTDNRDKLLFPVGKFRAMLWGSVYEEFIRPLGSVKRFHVVDSFKIDLRWLQSLGPIMEQAYLMRANADSIGDSPTKDACKIFINSIYGRLGMKVERERCYHGDNAPNGDFTRYKFPDGRMLWFYKTSGKTVKANFFYASYITDRARGKLLKGLTSVVEPYYCDTDSIYCKDPGSLDVGPSLGQWKYEGEALLKVFGAKDYIFGEKRTIKGGLPCDSCQRVMRKATFSRCAECGGKGELATQMTLKTLLRYGEVKGRKREGTTDYTKRAVYSSGRTAPHVEDKW